MEDPVKSQFTPIPEAEIEDDGSVIPGKRTSSIGFERPLLRHSESPFKPPSTPCTYIQLRDYIIKPDLSLYCAHCASYISLLKLNDHRNYHKSLETLEYPANAPPIEIEDVLKRRKKLLDREKSLNSSAVDITKLQKINGAYDILRSYIENPFETCREVDTMTSDMVTGTALDCSCDCILSVGICSDHNGRYKSSMEDRKVYQDFYGNDASKAFFGIYDGYHGHYAAEVASNELHHLLLQELVRFDPMTRCTCTLNMITDETISDYDDNRPYTRSSERVLLHEESTNMVQSIIHTCVEKLSSYSDKDKPKTAAESTPFGEKMSAAFVKCYQDVDRYLSFGLDEHSRVRWSGCSALTLLIRDLKSADVEKQITDDSKSPEPADSKSPEPADSKSPEPARKLGELYLAHAGDIRAVLVRDNHPYRLTKNHTLKNVHERNRVLKQGGSSSGGDTKKNLLVNGVLGTTRGLGSHGDPRLKRCISQTPYTTTVPIDQYAQFLILASRGVWEVFSEQEAATLVGQLLPDNLIPPPSRVSTSLQSLLDLYTASLSRASSTLSYSSSQGQGQVSRGYEGDVELDYPGKMADNMTGDEVDNITPDLRPDTGKSTTSRVSFALDNDIVEINDYDTEKNSDFDEISTEYPSRSSSAFSGLARDQLRRDFAKEMSERLVQAAILAGAKDNITVMVVLLPGSGL